MPNATKQPASISAMLDAAMADAAVYRTKPCAPPWSAPWDADEAPRAAAESRLLTIAEAAEVVPLSAKQLYRVAERADSPFRKVEGRLMAYEDELHRWIKAHPTGSKSAESPTADGDSLADRVRRRREGGAS
jgi:hypothetical protein